MYKNKFFQLPLLIILNAVIGNLAYAQEEPITKVETITYLKRDSSETIYIAKNSTTNEKIISLTRGYLEGDLSNLDWFYHLSIMEQLEVIEAFEQQSYFIKDDSKGLVDKSYFALIDLLQLPPFQKSSFPPSEKSHRLSPSILFQMDELLKMRAPSFIDFKTLKKESFDHSSFISTVFGEGHVAPVFFSKIQLIMYGI